jgi:hypothetical protein
MHDIKIGLVFSSFYGFIGMTEWIISIGLASRLKRMCRGPLLRSLSRSLLLILSSGDHFLNISNWGVGCDNIQEFLIITPKWESQLDTSQIWNCCVNLICIQLHYYLQCSWIVWGPFGMGCTLSKYFKVPQHLQEDQAKKVKNLKSRLEIISIFYYQVSGFKLLIILVLAVSQI